MSENKENETRELQEHAARGHAMLSASAANRWLHCPPSVRLSDGIPDKSSGYAEEGTKAHEMAEAYLNGLIDGKEDKEIQKEILGEAEKIKIEDSNYQSDNSYTILENVGLYVDYIVNEYNRLKDIDDDTIIMPEVQVNYDNVAKGGYGTSDCVIIGGGEIIIIDLKYGKGIEVSALGNPQLRLYAIGALNEFMPLYGDFKLVKTCIIQPRLDHKSEETMTPDELYAWGNNVVKPLANLAYKGSGNFQEGDWCRFCKAKGCCPLRAKENMELASDMSEQPEVEKLSDQDVARILTKGKDLVKWYKSVEDYATTRAMTGGKIPGYKIVEGRSKRIWTDDDEAVKKLKECGLGEDDIWVKNIITPTQALSELSARNVDDTLVDDVKNLTEKANLNPTLTVESDKREPLAQSVIDSLMNGS